MMHDKRRGALSLVRMLNGTLKVGSKIRTSAGSSEVVERIYEPLADDFKEIKTVERGNVAICSGLKVKFQTETRNRFVGNDAHKTNVRFNLNR